MNLPPLLAEMVRSIWLWENVLIKQELSAMLIKTVFWCHLACHLPIEKFYKPCAAAHFQFLSTLENAFELMELGTEVQAPEITLLSIVMIDLELGWKIVREQWWNSEMKAIKNNRQKIAVINWSTIVYKFLCLSILHIYDGDLRRDS